MANNIHAKEMQCVSQCDGLNYQISMLQSESSRHADEDDNINRNKQNPDRLRLKQVCNIGRMCCNANTENSKNVIKGNLKAY